MPERENLEVRLIQQAEWIERVELGDKTLYPLLRKDLDDGEAAAIALAIERHADLILLDETDARTSNTTEANDSLTNSLLVRRESGKAALPAGLRNFS